MAIMSIQERAQEAIKVLKAVNALGPEGFQKARKERMRVAGDGHPELREGAPLDPVEKAIEEATKNFQ